MDGEYDVIVCGTGFKECVISGLLSVKGQRVLHLDKNKYYGGESASLNLTNLFEKFRPGSDVNIQKKYGSNRNWNIDLVPKFVMACGKLVKILVQSCVTRYLEWQVIEETYVYQHQSAGMFYGEKFIHKVPSTDREAMASPLMGIIEKHRCKLFLQYCKRWDGNDRTTWKGLHPDRKTMNDIYDSFGLVANTRDFIGHALALYTNDNYMEEPGRKCLEKLQLYFDSISKYGKSPFIYPLYGLGGIPEGFSRLCAIYGGTFMLDTPIDGFEYDVDGHVTGVRSIDGQVARCKKVVCSPDYVQNSHKIRPTGRIVRCICILDHPVNEIQANSAQIIIPQKQVNRTHDIYVTLLSSSHGVVPQGYYLAMISTTVETDDPSKEIEPAIALLGGILEKFLHVSQVWVPTDNGQVDGIYVTASMDATSHFEQATEEIISMWHDITGTEIDLSGTNGIGETDCVE